MQEIQLTTEVIEEANRIKDENHDITNPKKYTKHRGTCEEFSNILKEYIGCDKVDYVLFSSKIGAEPHVDTHLTHLDVYTYIIPIIVSSGATLNTLEENIPLNKGIPIKINHQIEHSVNVSNDNPLVFIMASKVL